jgi:hypothetical protein
MIKFAQINIQTGEVLNVFNLQSAHGYTDGAITDGILFKRLPPDTDDLEFQQTQYWRDNQWNTRDKCPGPFYQWANYGWHLDMTSFWQGVKHRRQTLLSYCDWTQVADNQLTEEKRAEWRVYRQALRDLPTTQSSLEHPSDLVWPTKPS